MKSFRRKQADSGMPMLLVIPGKEILVEAPGVLDAAEALRKVRTVLKGFGASEYGLSSLVCGLLCVLVTPKSNSSKATGLDFIDDPLSA